MASRINHRKTIYLKSSALESLIDAIHCQKPVMGFTHDFYRYPARFSPQFANAVIQTFSQPGDVVMDPFMGGATTLVEARALNRIGIGLDVNELSCFLARVKTTPLTADDARAIRAWVEHTIPALNLRGAAIRPHQWIAGGYQRNINTRQTWPIRKSLELALARVPSLKSAVQQEFARAVLLRTGQWALDCRTDVPSGARFREKLFQFLDEMLDAAEEYQRVLDSSGKADVQPRTPIIIRHRSAETIHEDAAIRSYGAPRLVLTSPPYPGVHVLYHRWQILGRRETPAPFWISNTLDGSGSSYYAFGDRKQRNLQNYFSTALAAFSSLARISERYTIIVQMLAFSEVSWQLPKYLKTMRAAGFEEVKLQGVSGTKDGRLWRMVPNRKWYAGQRGSAGAAKEVVLFHRLRNYCDETSINLSRVRATR